MIQEFLSEAFDLKQHCFQDDGKCFIKLSETDNTEFKRSLHLKNGRLDPQYVKDVAAFSNNIGGLLVFGVDDKTREVVGLRKDRKGLDANVISSVADRISGSIRAHYVEVHISEELSIGVVTCFSSTARPVISSRSIKIDGSDYPAGTIFYRYPGESKVIMQHDLQRVINEEFERRTAAMLKRVQEIYRIGVDNAGVVDLADGYISLPNSESKVLIDEQIVSRLNIIDEAQVVENSGAPAYTIVGSIESMDMSSVSVRRELASIGRSDVARAFLYDECKDPKAFISAILHDILKYRPILYFLRKLELSKDEAATYLDSYVHADAVWGTVNKMKLALRPGGLVSANHSIIDLNEDQVVRCLSSEVEARSVTREMKLGIGRIVGVVRSAVFHSVGKQKKFGYIEDLFRTQIYQAILMLDRGQVVESQGLIRELLIRIRESTVLDQGPAEMSEYRKCLAFVDYCIYGFMEES